MGMYEDDRIRHKNKAVNEAQQVFSSLKEDRWSNGDIAAKAEQELIANPGNRTMYEVLKLALAADSN